MAKPKDGIPVGSTQAFYSWVKQRYPGWWPQDKDMGKIDWTTGRNLEMYNQWVTEGKTSTPIPKGQEPFPSPTDKTKPKGATSYNVIYGGTVWMGDDGKYYDPATGFPLSDDELKYRYQKFLQGEVNPLNTPQNPNEMTDYQKWQVKRQDYLDQTERDRQAAEGVMKTWSLKNENQRTTSESEIQKQQNELELIKGRAFPFGDERGRQRAMQEATSGAFESARQSILASLSSPSDWIKRWDVQNAANPYTPQPQSQLESSQAEVENTNTRANMFDQMADSAEQLVATLANDPNYGAGSPNEATVLTQARTEVANYRNAAEQERAKLPAFQANLTYNQGQPQFAPPQPAGRGGNAPAPAWLPMFAPGQRAGQAITKQDIPTPSAQQWTATPWSVQQGVAGYTDWAGYRPMADILGNMAQMLPNNPGGGARWSPYIGR